MESSPADSNALISSEKTNFVVSSDTRIIMKRWMTAPMMAFIPALNELLSFSDFVGGKELAVPPFEDASVQPFCVDPRSSEFWLVDMLTGEMFACKLNSSLSFDEMLNSKPTFTREKDTFTLVLSQENKKQQAPAGGGCCGGAPRPGGVANNQMYHPIYHYAMCVLCMGQLRAGQFNTCDKCSR
jgi:hypothetical protein